jgi:UDP-glucose 4-epimerase
VIERCIIGTHVVLKIANRYRKKLLLTSTSEIYGKKNEVPFSEEDDRLLGPTTKSRWSYSSAKAINEFLALAYCRDKGLPVVIARLFNTIGPRQLGQYGMVVPRFIKQALAGKPITVYGDGKQTRCFCHVDDAVAALVGLMDNDNTTGEIFNVGSDEEVTILELANRIKEIADSNSIIDFVPYDKAYEDGFEDMARRAPNIIKINKFINWRPSRKLDDTLNSIVKYIDNYEGGQHYQDERKISVM